ncbi:hypothetical protein O181_009105 [Austropuccinia psidii MF-1]|uniref:Reverse transcriptase Ty1/copia-type domain-containing protein n=1 Tax=Austropuccinia psidii MF-1 TaxID=1389203 RepID=A0A9Q3GJK2_9BASI|nr:hypothetical protein [Austropuccinia psidii MF-1]
MNVRATIGYPLGITPKSKAWYFWVPRHDRVVRSASVKFDKTTFFPGPTKPGAVLSTIQVTNIADNLMVKEINRQDAVITSLNSSHNMNDILLTSYKEALKLREAENWKMAIAEEIKSMEDEKVLMKVPLSQVLKSTKRDDIWSTSFDETFAPTPTFATLQLLLAISFKHQWPLKTFDVKVAFLHSYIDMPVYIWPPKGLETGKYTILQLKKSLYVTKQAARCWWMHLTEILKDIGFTANEEDASSYSYKSELGNALLWIHVDNSALKASSNKLLSHIALQLSLKLNIK